MNQQVLRQKVQEIQDYLNAKGIFSENTSQLNSPDFNVSFNKQIKTVIHKECEVLEEKERKRINNEFFNYGPLSAIILDQSITEIIINDQNSIWLEQNGELSKHSDCFLSKQSYQRIFHKICEEANCELSTIEPFADGKWKNFRLHVSSPPVSSTFKLNLRRKTDWQGGLNFFLENDTVHKQQFDLIKDIIKSKKTSLIIGSTGSGKTSILNACLQEIPENQRIVIIEDTDEITLPNSASTKLLTQTALKSYKQSARQEITQTELVKQSLRMRPDRIVLGEVRGNEAKDFLLALATGHEGSFCTLHANSATQALMRLEMLVQLGAPQWSLQTIRSLIAISIQYIILLEKVYCPDQKKLKRKITKIHQINGVEQFGVLLEEVF